MTEKNQQNIALATVQKYLTDNNIQALIINNKDHFLNYITDKKINPIYQLSNFSGSNATILILPTEAILFTDGRYILQAQQEIDTKLFKVFDLENLSIEKYLQEELTANSNIAINFLSSKEVELIRLKKLLFIVQDCNINILFNELAINLAANINKTQNNLASGQNSSNPDQQLIQHKKTFSGFTTKQKINHIVKSIKDNANTTLNTVLLLSSPEAVSWLLNLRNKPNNDSCSINCFAFITQEPKVYIFINRSKLTDATVKNLKHLVAFIDTNEESQYAMLEQFLKNCSEKKETVIQLDPITTNLWFINTLNNLKMNIIRKRDPCLIARAIKNPTEIKNITACQIRDSTAVCKFIYWLQKSIKGNVTVSEFQAAEKIHQLRASDSLFWGDSFPAISGYGKNGAIIHYHPPAIDSAIIKKNSLYLIDSGGHYHDGTTDVTRTLSFGTPTKIQKLHYTSTLRGHIALARAVFPKNTTGSQLDILARQYLWSLEYNYNHGTGHGVGFFSNVHEGPHSISPRSHVPLEPNMIVTNEPGCYIDNNYGIRLENVMRVLKKKQKDFLEFETLTLVPFDKKLIDSNLLNKSEKEWLNDYNHKIIQLIKPRLNKAEQNWLTSYIKIYSDQEL